MTAFSDSTLQARFAAKVARPDGDGCWLWTGAAAGWAGTEYGQISAYGRLRPAAQIAWELAHGEPFPPGMFACHTCDNTKCVNPDHIWPGTARDNALDAVAKGRLVNPKSAVCKRGHLRTPDNLAGHSCKRCQTITQRLRRANVVRGDTPFEANALKTHCKRGHPFNEENTTYKKQPDGRFYRECRICRREGRRAACAAKKRRVGGTP